MLKGFRAFVLRGNVIDLAVAFVVGAAFATLIGAFSEGLISPIVGIFLGGGVDVGQFTIRDQVIDVTMLVNAVITFVITLTVIYFVFVAPMNAYRRKTGQGVVDATPADVKLLMEIRDLLKEQQAPR
jgi:large conductance mechanosensitive channel